MHGARGVRRDELDHVLLAAQPVVAAVVAFSSSTAVRTSAYHLSPRRKFRKPGPAISTLVKYVSLRSMCRSEFSRPRGDSCAWPWMRPGRTSSYSRRWRYPWGSPRRGWSARLGQQPLLHSRAISRRRQLGDLVLCAADHIHSNFSSILCGFTQTARHIRPKSPHGGTFFAIILYLMAENKGIR